MPIITVLQGFRRSVSAAQCLLLVIDLFLLSKATEVHILFLSYRQNTAVVSSACITLEKKLVCLEEKNSSTQISFLELWQGLNMC